MMENKLINSNIQDNETHIKNDNLITADVSDDNRLLSICYKVNKMTKY